MKQFCESNKLLSDDNGVVRVPFLVKGKLICPPELSRAKIETAFANVDPGTDYLKLPDAQLLRERVIDRHTMQVTSDYAYQILPSFDPLSLVENDFDKLVRGPYALTVDEILAYLQTVARALQDNWALVEQVRELCRRTTEHPDAYLDLAFLGLVVGLDVDAARRMIDNELSAWQMPGSRFLDGWVAVSSEIIPGLVPFLANTLPNARVPQSDGKTLIRAMPTRQLHITAGNAPQIPIVSALRVVLTKSAGVIKLPHEVTLPGALVALAAATAAPGHPLTQNLSVVYWQGGDTNVENVLFMPGAFDRIVVWGAPDAVAAVQSKAIYTPTICFNPRYGVSLIGKETFSGDVEQVAFAAAMDAMIYNQKACTASQVQYVEGTETQVQNYADCLAKILASWDKQAPPFVPAIVRGQIKRMQRGKYERAEWHTNHVGDAYTSGVVVMPGEFDILDHPMCRLVIVRRVDDLRDAFKYLHRGVSTVGVYPEARRIALRDAIVARGVSNVLPLGECERLFAGAPQDGMMVLNQLVDWKNG